MSSLKSALVYCDRRLTTHFVRSVSITNPINEVINLQDKLIITKGDHGLGRTWLWPKKVKRFVPKPWAGPKLELKFPC